jgi:hypothetical protein
MSNASLDQTRVSKAPSVTELVSETRIDSPHPTASVAAMDKEVANETSLDGDFGGIEPWGHEEPIPSLPDPEGISGQVQIQATQLAEHLRSRQQQLDHREAELNAWAAQLERDTRAARLWLEERNAELEQAAHPAETIVLQEDAICRKAEALAQRERQLAETEAELETQRAALQKFHEQLTVDRQLLDDESLAQRERFTADQIRLAAEIDEKRREVQKRSEQTDQAHAALEQFRVELGRMHRETLEIRLATEELWAELSGSAPSAALTRSLGHIRSRLAEHYRMANLELHQKKEELEQLRYQLSQQYEKLVRQKGDFDVWATECREEAERQAARLMAHSEDLERREADMGEYARQAQAEKLELQQEIRRLRTKLAAKSAVELPA